MFLCAMVDVGGGQNIRLSNVLLWLCIVGEGLVFRPINTRLAGGGGGDVAVS